MTKVLSLQNLLSIKHEVFEFPDELQRIFGAPPKTGVWQIYGIEKNGKTAIALMMFKLLTQYLKTWYVSGEEDTDSLFVESVERTGLVASANLGFLPYTPLPELSAKLKKRNAAKAVFIDNTTIYADEFKRGGLERFIQEHKDKLIVIISHENKGEPDTAPSRYAKKLAKIYIRAVGMTGFVGGRCPGGKIIIHEDGADKFGIQYEY